VGGRPPPPSLPLPLPLPPPQHSVPCVASCLRLQLSAVPCLVSMSLWLPSIPPHPLRPRSIGYFLEAIIPLCLFARAPVRIVFTGVTNHPTDASVDRLAVVLPPMLKAFGVDTSGFLLKVRRRGFQPLGGGEVEFRCPNIRELAPCNWCDEGAVKRVRGLAVTAKVSPQVANRLTQSSRWASGPPRSPCNSARGTMGPWSLCAVCGSICALPPAPCPLPPARCPLPPVLARSVLDDHLPDVYVFTDHTKGKESGLSPGFSLTLTAETTSGCVLVAEKCSDKGALPEVRFCRGPPPSHPSWQEPGSVTFLPAV
jgi:RNA 3'-terminal phosphate cyclase-like protein